MSRTNLKLAPLVLLFLGFSYKSGAQDCATRIESSVSLYEQGQLTKVIELLENCVNSDNDIYRQNALRLRSMAHLGLSNMKLATEDAVALLNLNPTYRPSLIDDPADFVRLLQSITVIPKFSLGFSVSAGMNWINPHVTGVYSVSPYQERTYKGQQGYVFGASASYQFSEQWGLHAELVASNKRYQLEYLSGEADLNLNESLTYLSLPLSVRYIPGVGDKLKPYFELGGYGGSLLASQASYYSENIYFENEEMALERISTLNRRKRFDLGFLASAGVMYTLGPGRVSAQLSYRHSMVNITDETRRYDYTDLARRFYHIDDDVYLRNVLLQFGYQLFINYKVIE